MVSGQGLVWEASTVETLRTEHRILGCLVGSSPACPESQLPLLLMPEEVQLLKEKGLVRLVCVDWESRREERREKAACQREESYQGQIEEFRRERREVIVRHADRILQGRRKKQAQQKKAGVGQEQDELKEQEEDTEAEKELVIRQEVAKIKPITRDMAAVQIFPADPWLSESQKQPSPWSYPCTSPLQRCRLFTYKDLWNHSYYISEGAKFGGDFLVYPGDPVMFHARYIVICLESELDPRSRVQDLVAVSRLGTTVKKTVLFSWLEGQEVKYNSVTRGAPR